MPSLLYACHPSGGSPVVHLDRVLVGSIDLMLVTGRFVIAFVIAASKMVEAQPLDHKASPFMMSLA